MNTITAELTDEQALDLATLFMPWKSGTAYITGNRVRHGNQLYHCVQAHTSLSDWAPDATPALWTRISVDEYPEWVQPTGAQDAYKTGDKVTYQGERYVSKIDGNVWSPTEYPAGWQKV